MSIAGLNFVLRAAFRYNRIDIHSFCGFSCYGENLTARNCNLAGS
jgi:hypothetical protein